MARLHPVTVLILAELGLAAGCKKVEAQPAASPEPVPAAEPTPATSVASAPPVASAEPTSPPADPVACKAHGKCPKGLECVSPTDGHRILPGPGTCLPPGPHPGGRPLVVDGVTHVASTLGAWHASAAGFESFVATLRADALAEHASIPAFARTLCQLIALGAPVTLIEKTAAALQDETRHTRDSFAWLARLSGSTVVPGSLPAAVAPLEISVSELLRDVIRGGCIGETLAACTAHARAAAAPLDELRAFYRGIVEDEARHAALAYETARWLIALEPQAAVVVHEERTRFYAEASPADVMHVAPLLELL